MLLLATICLLLLFPFLNNRSVYCTNVVTESLFSEMGNKVRYFHKVMDCWNVHCCCHFYKLKPHSEVIIGCYRNSRKANSGSEP